MQLKKIFYKIIVILAFIIVLYNLGTIIYKYYIQITLPYHEEIHEIIENLDWGLLRNNYMELEDIGYKNYTISSSIHSFAKDPPLCNIAVFDNYYSDIYEKTYEAVFTDHLFPRIKRYSFQIEKNGVVISILADNAKMIMDELKNISDVFGQTNFALNAN